MFQCIRLRTMAKQLSNPEKYSKPCQTSKMDSIPKTDNSYKSLYFFVHSILDVWQSSGCASVICYSLFKKTENTNKID